MKATYIGETDEDIEDGETLDVRFAVECKPKHGGLITMYYDSLDELNKNWKY